MKLNRRAFFKLIGAAVTVLAAPKFVEARLSKIHIEPKILFVNVGSYSNQSTVIHLAVGKKVVGVMDLPKGIDLYEAARIIENYIETQKPTFTCVQTIGIGHAMCDVLKSRGHSVVGASKFSRNPEHRELAKFFEKNNSARRSGSY